MWPVKMTGEVTGQGAFLAGHCPLTGRYFEPCLISVLLENSEVQLVSREIVRFSGKQNELFPSGVDIKHIILLQKIPEYFVSKT